MSLNVHRHVTAKLFHLASNFEAVASLTVDTPLSQLIEHYLSISVNVNLLNIREFGDFLIFAFPPPSLHFF